MRALTTPLLDPASRRRTACRVGTAALAFATAVSIGVLAPQAAQADPAIDVSPTTTTSVASNSTTTLVGLGVVSHTNPTMQVTIAATAGTISIPSHANLTLAYNNHWSGDASITFTGDQTDADAGLSSTQLVTTGADAGRTASISLSASFPQPGYIYSAPNQHFYQYVADPGITWANANAAAQALTFNSQQGYLATIPNDAINDFVSNRIQGAQNVWFGAESVDTPDSSPARTWQWAGGPLAGQPISYCTNFIGTCNFASNAGLYSHWAPVEPNNYGATPDVAHSGEFVAVTNWQGSSGEWNDLPSDWANVSEIAGYVVEYGNRATGSSTFDGVYRASSNVAITGPPAAHAPGAPRHLKVRAGDRVLTLRFAPPTSNGGAPIRAYQVSLDGGRSWRAVATTTSGSSRTASVGGVLNGARFRVQVRAVNAVGAGPSTAAVPAVTTAWFHDPIGPSSRRHEIAVPNYPTRVHGKARWTTALARAHNGSPAMPVGSLRGRQLQPGQAVSLGTNALFAFDSSTLRRSGLAAVRSLVASLQFDKSIVCEGYADYGGRAGHEKALSARRARAVCTALTRFGAHVQTRTHGYGRQDPVIVGGTPAQRAANRRVILLVNG